MTSAVDDVATFTYIDRVVTISFRPRGMSREAIPRLYEAARGDSAPISSRISSALLEQRGAKVGLLTGAAVPDFLPKGENDGPLGTIVLANALQALDFEVSILTETELGEIFDRLFLLYGADFDVVELQKDDPDDHRQTCPDLDILVAIEKLGSNEHHVMHGATGLSRNGTRAHVDGLVNRMNEDGKLTVGIGDGGNEVGFGKLYDLARATVDFGSECRCPCGGGIVTTTSTALLYPVGVSNWGAYAVVSALAASTRRRDILHTPERELELLAVAEEVDCRDGGSGVARAYVDGVPARTSAALVEILRTLAEEVDTERERSF
jgi:D-glutamate cyclase